MKLIVIQCLTILVTILTVNCGMQLNFGVNLPPFVLRLPRFKLPPVKMSVTFNHSPDSQPLKIHFPGISISNSNQNHDSWSDNSVEPESEPEHHMYHEPESEPEPEPEVYSHHHQQQQFNYHQQQHHHQYHQQKPLINHGHNYNHNHDFYGDRSFGKSTPSTGIGSYHLQQRSRRDSMLVSGTNGPINSRQTKIVIKPIDSKLPSSIVTQPSSITNNHPNNLRLTLIAPPKSTSPLPAN